ncbi:MAG: hypothetical protein BMS9Abin37_2408 [Acidobacteriota bacterium]|nr:MAG: hypothetical protein BMS9Abin37_2408 [Acidobacteriota bacterium]
MGPQEESRTSHRFVPAFSLAASILDRDLHVVHGMVANLSEVGASLLTCRSVDDGTYVALELRQQDHGVVETLARVVWTWDGVVSATEASGSLVGVSFCGLSAAARARIWTCSSTRPSIGRNPEPIPFTFDQLSEPEVDWFLARELGGRKAIGSRRPEPRSSLRTPPSLLTPRR